MTSGNDDKRRAGDGDDMPPSGDEARSQRDAAMTPMLWLVLGLILIVGFVFFVSQGGGLFHAQARGPAPVRVAP